MARSIRNLFLITLVFIWIFVTFCIFRFNTRNEISISTREYDYTVNIIKELQKQNLQLRELASQISAIQIQKNDTVKQDEGKNLIESARSRLTECLASNKRLSFEIENLVLQRADNATKSEDHKTLDGEVSTDQSTSIKTKEFLSRTAYINIVELWYYLKSSFSRLKGHGELTSELKQQLDDLMEEVKLRKRAALVEMEMLQESLSKRQMVEMAKLSKLVQKRINYLQNPKDCKNARKLLCNLNKACGFGCQVHHITYCMLIAFGTRRTLILDSRNWRYSSEGWSSVFLPLSTTCTIYEGQAITWNGEEETENIPVVMLPIIDNMPKRPSYLPLAIPEDLAPRLIQYHGNPIVWWLGQIEKFLMRPQAWIESTLKDMKNKFGFVHPVVGRTDKVGTEAAYHSIDEYMEHVIEWFDKEDMKRHRQSKSKIDIRRVYLASDDSSVLSDALMKYPEYKFLSDSEITKSAGVSSRYSKSGLLGIVIDILLLSKCDYIVGTFSSQVSRLAYELMQTYHTDATLNRFSLDDIFYFGGQNGHQQRVLYDQPKKMISGTKMESIELKHGDVIGVAGNHWDGLSMGLNTRTHQRGLYPSYVVRNIVDLAKFPTYPEADAGK